MGDAPLVVAVAALPPVAALTAAFLRCEEAATVTLMCTAAARAEGFRNRCLPAARESQRNSDIREAVLKRRAQRRAVWAAQFEHGEDSEFDSASIPSIGFSIDSDGHWHEHDNHEFW